MATLVKEVRLIKAENGIDPKTGKPINSYKYWNAKLYDDETWTAVWGRVGCENPEDGSWTGAKKFEAKVREKLGPKKNYTEQKTIGEAVVSSAPATVVRNGDLHAITKAQILTTTNPVLDQLIKRFVDANVHKITSSTQITYNSTTGLFTTPLGLVSMEGLTEARDLLADLTPSIKNRRFGPDADKILCKYLRIIPQSLGMKRFSVETLIPDDNALQKQLDLVDSLESSYQAMTSAPAAKTPTGKSQEQVFKVDLDVLTDKTEISRITKWFNQSNHSTHGYSNIRIVNYLKLKVHDNWNNFNEKLGNLKEVWHGTGEPNLLSILKVGLKASPPSTTKITGKMFNDGHYGALDSSKSMQYTFGRFGGSSGTSGWLIVADFALGNTHYIRSYGGSRPSGYDSIWAKKENTGLRFDELIVPRDNQVRIKYLLELK